MHWLILLLLIYTCNWTYPSEVDENFQVPIWTSLKDHDTKRKSETPSPSSSVLPKPYQTDSETGCCCRETSSTITCFGSETCIRFPRNVRMDVDKMKLRNTKIKELMRGDLNKTTHLMYLEIEANYHLERVGGESFRGMTALRNLSISFNPRLATLEVGCFDGLVNLEELTLIKNGFTNLSHLAHVLTPKHLPKLAVLKLNENAFGSVQETDLWPMENSPVMELGLVLCQIEYMHPASLAPLRQLRTLRLGENLLNTSVLTDLILKSTERGVPLQRLNLYSMGFKKRPPSDVMRAVARSNVTVLNLSRNQFELLRNDSFPFMPHLVQLDLRDTLAVNIDLDAFTSMPNLKILLLSRNKLITVPRGVLLPRLNYLDLSLNANMHTPSYFSLERNKFANMTNLWGLNLSFNNIHVLFNYSFVGLTNLKILGLREASIFYIGKDTFMPLRNLIYLDLDSNPFPNTGNFTKDIFRGLDKLKVLSLSRCSISALADDTFVHLKSLERLALIDNRIATLTPQLFRPLRNLIRIDLDENLLSSWTQRLFDGSAQLEEITLTHNKITHLTDAMVEDLYTCERIDLSRNPINCNCLLYRTLSMNVKRRNSDKLIRLLDEETTYCAYPDEHSHVTVAEYYNITLNDSSSLCRQFNFYTITALIIPLVIVAVIIMIVLLLIYKYRHHIQYWIFLTKLTLWRNGKLAAKKRTESARYEYDAFVSYSNEDMNFVVRLVAMLENYEPFLKLCVYERDFQIGTIITESVLDSVAKSRKTLLVISDSYVKSHWCQWEAHVAEHHRLFFENEFGDLVDDSIVIVKLGDVPSAHMTPMLKYLMKTRVYLQWDAASERQRVFWEKLRRALAPPAAKNGEQTTSN